MYLYNLLITTLQVKIHVYRNNISRNVYEIKEITKIK